MSNIKGACVFRNDGDGCLSSKYVNEHTSPFGETCKLLPESRSPDSRDVFEGQYNTAWLQSTVNPPFHAMLTIVHDPLGFYKLTWLQPSTSNVIYSGIGMLYNDLLTCGYWSGQ